MIIKNMAEFGKAVDEGKCLEVFEEFNEAWAESHVLNAGQGEFRFILNKVGKRHLRTKRITTYYRVYEIEGELFIDSDNSPFPKWESINRDHIHDFQIESED